MANYPWDGSTDPNSTYSTSPDDAAFRYLASVYANAHTEMHKSLEFPGGITNGAHWYPLSGGMQVNCHTSPTLTCMNPVDTHVSAVYSSRCTWLRTMDVSAGNMFSGTTKLLCMVNSNGLSLLLLPGPKQCPARGMLPHAWVS